MQVGGEGQLINPDTGENESQVHTQTLWIKRTSQDLSLQKCGVRGITQLQRRTQPVLDRRRLNVGIFSGCCLACKPPLRTTARHKTGQAAQERYASRERDKRAKTRIWLNCYLSYRVVLQGFGCLTELMLAAEMPFTVKLW